MDTATAAASPPAGVLLVNLGSPTAPTPEAVRAYLDEFLSDPRVVDWPRWLWLPVLRRVVLPRRAPRSAALYRRVWRPDGSPLLAISAAQATALAERLGPGAQVAVGMRYGRPSLAEGLQELVAAGCRSAVVLPLFPQEAEATTGSIAAALASEPLASRLALRIVPPFHSHPAYLDALAESVHEARREWLPDHHVFSFHGIPERLVRRGAPYRRHCEATAAGLARRLELADGDWTLAFQSRFGPERWLGPNVDEVVARLAPGCRRVLVACPGFPADCLETLDEIGDVLASRFRTLAGGELRLVPGLNVRPSWIDALATLVEHA